MKKQQVIKVIKANAVATEIPVEADAALEKEPATQRGLANTVEDWITERRETSRTEERSSFKQLKAWNGQSRKPRKKSKKS